VAGSVRVVFPVYTAVLQGGSSIGRPVSAHAASPAYQGVHVGGGTDRVHCLYFPTRSYGL